MNANQPYRFYAAQKKEPRLIRFHRIPLTLPSPIREDKTSLDLGLRATAKSFTEGSIADCSSIHGPLRPSCPQSSSGHPGWAG